jgi:hypothetical protein
MAPYEPDLVRLYDWNIQKGTNNYVFVITESYVLQFYLIFV